MTEAHWDLAKSVQIRFEEVANHLLKQLHERLPNDTLALAGGCAHNSVWVGKIPRMSAFKRVLVAPASHDAGLAVGAAAVVAGRNIEIQSGHWGLLGPTEEVESEISDEHSNVTVEKQTFPREDKLIDWIVEQLCQKKIVGLCHGRMEFGPRALGSRSLLADPRHADMKDLINRKVKHRENFRPFAASVLWEHQDKWFRNSFLCPSMEGVFEVEQPAKIPGVVHVDNTCRIQSVTRETQPFFHSLLERFREKTGIPLLLNTSFNDSEPIVCSSQDAYRCFIRSGIDCLVVGNRAYSRLGDALALSA